MDHKYHTGERVYFFDSVDRSQTGTIVRPLLSQYVDEDLEPDQPWYEVLWDHETWIGREPEASLIKI